MSQYSLAQLCEANERLARADISLWGAQAQPIAQDRLGWIGLPEKSRELLPALDALSAWARAAQIGRIVLSGMGGSSLAPEVIATHYGRELLVLDSTHPADVAEVINADPTQTLFIISSKSGETIETLSHLKAIQACLQEGGLPIENHVVVISDPGSPLLAWADENHVRSFAGQANVGGRFSALSIFGLLPASLIGVDCAVLLDDAADMREELQQSGGENLAIQLTQEILAHAPYLVLPDQPFSDWVEQLVAESTGKEGRGIIPVKGAQQDVSDMVRKASALGLGASFYLWEWTVALLGSALEVNPFDQPDVARAKSATSKALTAGGTFAHHMVQTTQGALALIDQKFTHPGGYIGVLAFVPMRDSEIGRTMHEIRQGLQDRFRALDKKVTFGYGPRYLHSTGQCHKGGPAFGSFLIITLDGGERGGVEDFPIPQERYSFGELLRAQALGDCEVLTEIGRQVVHAHLTRDELTRFSQSLRVTS